MDRPLAESPLVPLGTTLPRPLDLQALRADLIALWREEGHGVSRACHATLALVVSPEEDPEPLLDDLLLTHPSRVLRIERDPKVAAGDVVAWASGSCMKRSSGMLVCSETIHLHLGPEAEPRLPSVIRSLAVGGVPLAVICRQVSPLGLAWIHELRGDLDLIVGRSGTLDRNPGVLLWNASREAERRPRVEDLAWEEQEPWRRAIQSSFDRADEIPHLAALSGVEMDAGGSVLEALHLAGWLGWRLQWRESRGSTRGRVRVTGPGGDTEIMIVPGQRGTGLRSVTFSFRDGRGPLGWSADGLAGTYRVPQESPSAALSRALHRHEADPRALATRRMAVNLAQSWSDS